MELCGIFRCLVHSSQRFPIVFELSDDAPMLITGKYYVPFVFARSSAPCRLPHSLGDLDPHIVFQNNDGPRSFALFTKRHGE
jgi:hypothetical protein